eukprot:CAMPEP_0176172308 /NCGR_PEP_ID=MMETSP0120_2-20121206/88274_1 /TAXON_ID=160619 /ORGANISM="Kryptoperidinium foliaceum, Strain CCMP 1326" /LENGTH=51 /DNA_ID=CAMNT_0017510281 /DNA_START=127 /DNA_END=278 /DNA_ORIENTATION=+
MDESLEHASAGSQHTSESRADTHTGPSQYSSVPFAFPTKPLAHSTSKHDAA